MIHHDKLYESEETDYLTYFSPCCDRLPDRGRNVGFQCEGITDHQGGHIEAAAPPAAAAWIRAPARRRGEGGREAGSCGTGRTWDPASPAALVERGGLGLSLRARPDGSSARGPGVRESRLERWRERYDFPRLTRTCVETTFPSVPSGRQL